MAAAAASTDCPFSAITLEPRSDGAAFAQQAVVNAAHCVACGICVGACPTATPFRRRDGAGAWNRAARRTLGLACERTSSARGAKLEGTQRVVVLSCRHGARVPESPSVAVIRSAVCRHGAAAVHRLRAGAEDCRWCPARRLSREGVLPSPRTPVDRASASPRSATRICARACRADRVGRVMGCSNAAGAAPSASRAVSAKLAERIAGAANAAERVAIRRAGRTSASRGGRLGKASAYSRVAALLGYFSMAPTARGSRPAAGRGEPQLQPRGPAQATLHAVDGRGACETADQHATAAQLPARALARRGRARRQRRVAATPARYAPAGLWNDGPSTVYKRFAVPAGADDADRAAA